MTDTYVSITGVILIMQYRLGRTWRGTDVLVIIHLPYICKSVDISAVHHRNGSILFMQQSEGGGDKKE